LSLTKLLKRMLPIVEELLSKESFSLFPFWRKRGAQFPL